MSQISMLTISLRESINGNATSDDILKGYHARIIVDPNDGNETVASYAKKHVLKKPDWLLKICAKVGFNVLVSFGDGQNINVQIKNKNSKSSDSSSKKKATSVVSIHLGLFLRDGDDPAMLDPRENLNKIMRGSNLSNGAPQLLICQSHPWSDNTLTNEIEASDTSLILITKNNQLHKVLTSEEPSTEELSQKKKRKKRVDPNAPKKLNSYQVFMADRRTKNPDASFAELSKISGEEWRGLSVKEKEPFEKLAEEDKARFEKKMATYVNPYASDDEPPSPKKRRKKDPNAPKAPLSVYLRFCNKMRPEVKEQNPDVPSKDLFVILASKYKEISTEEKETLVKAYDEERLQYQKELKAYQELKDDNHDENTKGMKKEDTKTASPSKERTTSKKMVKNQDDEQTDTLEKTNDDDEEDSPKKATKRSPSRRTSTVSKGKSKENEVETRSDDDEDDSPQKATKRSPSKRTSTSSKGKSNENEVETSSKKKGSKRSTLKRKSKKDESPVKTRSKKEDPETPATKVKERKSTGRKKRRKSSAKGGK